MKPPAPLSGAGTHFLVEQTTQYLHSNESKPTVCFLVLLAHIHTHTGTPPLGFVHHRFWPMSKYQLYIACQQTNDPYYTWPVTTHTHTRRFTVSLPCSLLFYFNNWIITNQTCRHRQSIICWISNCFTSAAYQASWDMTLPFVSHVFVLPDYV